MWAHHDQDWGALANGQTLAEACVSTFAQRDCALTCCSYLMPSLPPPPPSLPPPPPSPPPLPPELTVVIVEELEAVEHRVVEVESVVQEELVNMAAGHGA